MKKRSKHSLSHYKLLTMDMGEMVPCGLVEVLPGDTIQQATSLLVRTTPLNAPLMHPVHIKVHHWFVPTRLLWDNWEDFITGGDDGANASVPPTISMGGSGAAVGSLADYLGVPTGVVNLAVSALPFRAYALIWNNWYRDEDLQTELVISKAAGVDVTTSTVLQNVCWEKDYFTTSRPWPQKGPAVTIPLGTRAPVLGIGTTATPTYGTSNVRMSDGTLHSGVSASASTDIRIVQSGTVPGYPDVYADLSNASAATIIALREAFAVQRYQEARARYGSRFVEYIRYLGVTPSDARLQLPEYLGGGSQTLQISEVLQTTPDTGGSGLEGVGALAGHGIGAVRSNRYRKFFEEHGFVLSFVSVKPITVYANGLPKLWSRTNKFDYWQPEFEHVGADEVMRNEVYAVAGDATVFGYQDRYDSYRRVESSIAAEFRTTLNFWHMARMFSSAPTLNASFVKAVPTDLIYQTPSSDNLQIMAAHSIQARRLLSSGATPRMM